MLYGTGSVLGFIALVAVPLLFWLALRARSLPPYLNKTSTSTTNAAIAATRRAASPHDLVLPQFMAQPMPKRRGTTTDESSRFT